MRAITPSVLADLTEQAAVTRAQVAADGRDYRSCNIGVAVVARTNTNIEKGISRIQPDNKRCQLARRRTGDDAQRSHVAEITELVDLSRWPAGTRLIVRREHIHQGAQRSLFPSLCCRYWGHHTDADGTPGRPLEPFLIATCLAQA